MQHNFQIMVALMAFISDQAELTIFDLKLKCMLKLVCLGT